MCVFFLFGFSLTNTHDSQDSSWTRGYLLIFFLPLTPAYRHLDINWVIAAEILSLRIAGSWNRWWNLWTHSLEFTLSTLELVAAVVRKMLKTRVTLGNISRVLLNLTKRLIFAMFKDSSFNPMFTQLTFIFSL